MAQFIIYVHLLRSKIKIRKFSSLVAVLCLQIPCSFHVSKLWAHNFAVGKLDDYNLSLCLKAQVPVAVTSNRTYLYVNWFKPLLNGVLRKFYIKIKLV